MSNKNYNSGRNFEYKRKKWYESVGCVCLRTAGSHGFADLVTIDTYGHISFIQCKRVKTVGQAKAIISKFTNNPPLSINKGCNCTQVIDVYVTSTRELLRGWVREDHSHGNDFGPKLKAST